VKRWAFIVAVGIAGFAWQLFPDPAQAGYMLDKLLLILSMSVIWTYGDRTLRLGAAGGIALGAVSAACAVWYEKLASKTCGVCDQGTGRPVTAVVALLFLVLVAVAYRGEAKWR
jgi:hypothetical protein